MRLKPALWNTVVWLGIPLAFAVFARLTYTLGVNRPSSKFYPGVSYWLVAVLTFLFLGAFLLHRFGSTRRTLPWIIYFVGMGAALVLLQGTVSCLAGDCI